MTGSAKRKGDACEREVAALLNELLGVPAQRMLGAGRLEDVGDIAGVPNTTVQCANRQARFYETIREKPLQADQQRERAGNLFAMTFVRLRGGEYRVVLTVDQAVTLWREAQPVPSVDGLAARRLGG